MTILIAAAVFCVWAYFWVRGALWAALPVPLFLAVANYDDAILHHVTYGVDHWASCALLAAAFFIPYAIKRYRAAKMDRLLNGIRFRDVRGD
ncbi:hypothetical protein ACFFGF_04735 [Asaia lannensis]|uniref:Uncharacterized protein n=1 Tax=Asaia lannensis NBRC 102526 TaxID=1307926 RepID=A0ABT1CIK1_9PROT|nr:hypothetical protein [Asaia lannensis]MCO6160680.1 hypothetical protein [Asaia lannensis NBRC 102526]GBR01985.1 hypothetical protein AA102526_2680 [Asaia lannensis NBRC 102526]